MSAPDQAQPVYCFSVFASPEASVMPRVLELFAKRGLTPDRFHGAVAEDGLSIDIQCAGLDEQVAEHIAVFMRNLVYVDRVLTATKLAPSSRAVRA
jgi:acetolactate synthase small subunit